MFLASNKGRRGRSGFSLTELLVVLGVIGILAVAGLPALRGISGSTGRTGAINGLLSALDQARSLAIRVQTNAYVAFPDAGFSDANYVYRSYAIFRELNPDLETNTGIVQAGKWERLPQGVALVSSSVTALPQTSLTISLPGNASTNATATQLRVIGFNASGGLTDPAATNGITVYEGTWDGTRGVPARANRIVDRITLQRLTGRAFLSPATNTSGTY